MDARPMKYPEIVKVLREQIEAGVFGPGSRVPSENSLARRFAVSRPTAGRALRELESANLVERRPGSGTYVLAEGSRGRESAGPTFGLLVQGLGATEVLDPICTEITKKCQEEHSTVLWGDSSAPQDAAAELDRLTDYYIQRGVDGVFFAPLESVPHRERENVRAAERLKAAGVAVVLLDRDTVDFPGRSDLDLVGIDNVEAGMSIGRYLAEVGHRRVAFLAKPNHPSTTDLRAIGCWAALRRAGTTPLDGWQLSGDPTDGKFVESMLAGFAPEAVVCSNDLTAALLIQTLLRLGASVPDDLAVVGFDDVKYSTLLSTHLTTMRQPCRGIARAAVRVMHDRLRDPSMEPQQILLRAQLIVRQSGVPGRGAPARRP